MRDIRRQRLNTMTVRNGKASLRVSVKSPVASKGDLDHGHSTVIAGALSSAPRPAMSRHAVRCGTNGTR